MSMTWLPQEPSDEDWVLVEEAVADVAEIDELAIEDGPEIKDGPEDEPEVKFVSEIAKAILNTLLEPDEKKQTAKQKPADPSEDWGYSKCRVCMSTVHHWSMLGEFCSHACRKKTLKTFHQ